MYAAGHVIARVPVGVLVELPHSCIRYGIRMLLGGKRIERRDKLNAGIPVERLERIVRTGFFQCAVFYMATLACERNVAVQRLAGLCIPACKCRAALEEGFACGDGAAAGNCRATITEERCTADGNKLTIAGDSTVQIDCSAARKIGHTTAAVCNERCAVCKRQGTVDLQSGLANLIAGIIAFNEDLPLDGHIAVCDNNRLGRGAVC